MLTEIYRFAAIIALYLLIGTGNNNIASCASDNNNFELKNEFILSAPRIQVFRPRGLRVSIPHYRGVHLFAFHGNINKPMDFLEAGQMSKDILRKRGNEWVFEDTNAEVDVGDKIYYWYFVIRNNLGYRYDDGVFVVSNITKGSIREHEASLDSEPSTSISLGATANGVETASTIAQQDMTSRLCEKIVLNLTETLLGLQYQIASLQDTNVVLRELVEKAPAGAAKTLRLDGRIPPNDDPLFTVMEIIRTKLNLSVSIVKAVRNSNKSIDFEVSTLNEKLAVIGAAKDKLKHSKIILSY